MPTRTRAKELYYFLFASLLHTLPSSRFVKALQGKTQQLGEKEKKSWSRFQREGLFFGADIREIELADSGNDAFEKINKK